jgi:hypothetical protein
LTIVAAVLSSCGDSHGSSANIKPLVVSFVKIPALDVPNYRTSGKYPVVSFSNESVKGVDSALRAAIVTAEQRYARFAREAESRWPPALRKRLNRYEHGTFQVLPKRRWISASSVVVSALFPVLELLPGGNDGETWTSTVVRFPSGQRIRLPDLFKDQHGLAALAYHARKIALIHNRCVRASVRSPITGNISLRGFAPSLTHYRFFALTPSGLAIGFPTGQVGFPGCGRVEVTVPFAILRTYLNATGKVLVAGVRSPS